MKKIVFTIFAMPDEIDDLERLLFDLNRASKFVDGKNYEFCITMTLDDYLFNWNDSVLKKEFFQERFYHLKHLTEWASNSKFQIREDIIGCSSLRRIAHTEYLDATHFIWLDTDICFDEKILFYIDASIDAIAGLEGVEKYVLSPECVRIWDETWDCLVNEKYLTKEVGYCKINNPFIDSGECGEVSLETVINNYTGQPRMKFGGGWFNCLSKKLLDRVSVPDGIGHYGPDDTFIMWASEKLNANGEQIQQFKMKNYVVCENYAYRNRDHYKKLITKIDRKNEFREKANSNFGLELSKIQ